MIRLRSAVLVVTAMLLVAVADPGSAQTARERQPKIRSAQRAAILNTMKLVDAAAAGDLGGGDAWLKWSGHFLRGRDGKTYVPFMLTIAEAPRAFGSLAMYVRVAKPGVKLTRSNSDLVGLLAGTSGVVPVGVPDRFRGRGAPESQINPSDNFALLRLLQEKGDSRYPFEDIHFIDFARPEDAGERRIDRALAVAPGDYELYVSIQDMTSGPDRSPKSAVLKQVLKVPDLSAGLATSSVIVAERVEPLHRVLDPREQTERPYAVSPVEIVPASDARFTSSEDLTIIFFVYNPAVDSHNRPDVVVEYGYYERTGLTERLFRREAQIMDAQSVPTGLDPRTGSLAVVHSMPLQSLHPGEYRLEIKVTDRLSSTVLTRDVDFVVVATTK